MFKIDTQAHQPKEKDIEPSSHRTLVNDSDVHGRDRGSDPHARDRDKERDEETDLLYLSYAVDSIEAASIDPVVYAMMEVEPGFKKGRMLKRSRRRLTLNRDGKTTMTASEATSKSKPENDDNEENCVITELEEKNNEQLENAELGAQPMSGESENGESDEEDAEPTQVIPRYVILNYSQENIIGDKNAVPNTEVSPNAADYEDIEFDFQHFGDVQMSNEDQFQNRNDLDTSYSFSYDQQMNVSHVARDTYENSNYSSCEDDIRGDQVMYLSHESENGSLIYYEEDVNVDGMLELDMEFFAFDNNVHSADVIDENAEVDVSLNEKDLVEELLQPEVCILFRDWDIDNADVLSLVNKDNIKCDQHSEKSNIKTRDEHEDECTEELLVPFEGPSDEEAMDDIFNYDLELEEIIVDGDDTKLSPCEEIYLFDREQMVVSSILENHEDILTGTKTCISNKEEEECVS
ncbi:uncharacterized protein LOC131856828 [Cryptomeria japonica]|uniref:uncharacterized protein LOC131856828 n=1 Tax=Cryptomeria japonica TaxID=3369 RepID=UPI0027DA57D2|nr:uncharacterized protein LOC131856828 [Cryptomeria japonica]